MNRIIKNLFLLIVIVIAAKFLFATFGKGLSTEYTERIILGDWTEQSIETLIEKAGAKDSLEGKIEFLSESFLGAPYADNTLGGGSGQKEQLTVDLSGLDCFTYIDYVESLRLSGSFGEFKGKLAEIRYKDGAVKWERRKHFFSDWVSGDDKNAHDATREVGGRRRGNGNQEIKQESRRLFVAPGSCGSKKGDKLHSLSENQPTDTSGDTDGRLPRYILR